MRRILRKVAANKFDDLGDISTLAEPSVVQEIIDNHKNMMEKKAWKNSLLHIDILYNFFHLI